MEAVLGSLRDTSTTPAKNRSTRQEFFNGFSTPGPELKYQPIAEIVERIWQKAEQLCSKRLAAALPLWLPYYG